MGSEKQNRRVCKYCGVGFELTKRQMRQQKKAIFCSRSCARRHQHAKNHADKRQEKECEFCGIKFVVANWNREKRFCSIPCSSKARFKKPTQIVINGRNRLKAIIEDKPYYEWLKRQAIRFEFKYGIDHEDLLQAFLLSVVEGSHGRFEQCWFGEIRKELKRGLTGSYDAVPVVGGEDILKSVKENSEKMDRIEFIEYLVDLQRMLSETEFKLVCLYLIGFDKGEIYEQCKDLSRRELVKFWDKIGIKQMRLWST